MIAGHRWERDDDWLGYKCVPLPLGGVESHQWCVGCGCRIGDLDLRECRGEVGGVSLNLFLDILARGRGYEPVEAGTFAEFELKKKTIA